MTKDSDCNGIVISSSRRNATVLLADNRQVPVRLSSNQSDLIVGDRVKITDESGDRYQLVAIEERENCLSRTSGNRTKKIAVNLDHLLLVTAIDPLFNTAFTDRVLLVCAREEIPVSIVVNKVDLGLEDTQFLIDVYNDIGINVYQVSALSEGGLEPLNSILNDSEQHVLALAGVSGVGKSTIINALVPEANRKTSQVSRKTGKGRQTTSMAKAYVFERSCEEDILLIDLPGIQNFGVSNLEKREVADSFPEFKALASQCEYADCLHLAEPLCAVQIAVDSGLVAPSRYLSYLGIIEEIEAFKPY